MINQNSLCFNSDAVIGTVALNFVINLLHLVGHTFIILSLTMQSGHIPDNNAVFIREFLDRFFNHFIAFGSINKNKSFVLIYI